MIFGSFIVALLALVVELIKSQKNILSLVMNHDPTGL
ncbi:putative holin-like toxin [Lactiplantibacillus plantarum]|nr:putative holin-like toxin [Lactiplantibacillus plantarum]